MNRYAVVDDDVGGVHDGKKKKREKKGFKVDRYENYRQRCAKGLGGKGPQRIKSTDSTAGKRVKAVTFDEGDRREYLSMHKRKNERRVKAFVEAKQKTKWENSKMRRAQREEARQAYNKFAAVPILPNFTYRLPVGDEGHEDEDSAEASDEEDEQKPSRSGKATANHRRLVAEEKTMHTMPASMLGGVDDDNLAMAKPCCHLDDEFVTVEVKPIGGTGHGNASSLPANDFSDLPAAVEREMLRLKRETKGPAKTKARVHMMKELEKIRKIKKHSRKGHGKKSAKGKRRNRRR
uniref:Uncharacterized protein n=1 Tax=Trypanosoma congolense (strain IL3000) TaxID=1068625 RepID=G0UVP5_TRYCI|nr:conserved hypothetical protein [Trypanosoma congolense IL3000]